ncbi:hypothetical protein VF673_11845 [Halopseudomonas sp. Lyrl_26]|uniref:hypothetical protein n=1 Tax=Halopseudomonas sp. Lyrl_26 TaxID=3110923 RepID=UPI003F821F36
MKILTRPIDNLELGYRSQALGNQLLDVQGVNTVKQGCQSPVLTCSLTGAGALVQHFAQLLLQLIMLLLIAAGLPMPLCKSGQLQADQQNKTKGSPTQNTARLLRQALQGADTHSGPRLSQQLRLLRLYSGCGRQALGSDEPLLLDVARGARIPLTPPQATLMPALQVISLGALVEVDTIRTGLLPENRLSMSSNTRRTVWRSGPEPELCIPLMPGDLIARFRPGAAAGDLILESVRSLARRQVAQVQTQVLAPVATNHLLSKKAASAMLMPTPAPIEAARASQALQPWFKPILKVSDHAGAILAETLILADGRV